MNISQKIEISQDPALIEEILTRSVSAIFPSKEELKKILMTGKKLRIYIGADPTGPQLHLGHATNFILLEKLRKLGHEIIVLFGDFTAMIGDPSGKDAVRVKLSPEQVEENIKTWKEQISKLVDLEDEANPAKIMKNASWLSKLTLSETIELAAHFTVQQMIERDMFQKRLTEHKPIYLHEFLYPLMVGYDSVAMDVDIELGGNDQTFNMLAGRILQKKINDKEKFVISTTLLVNPKTGEKFMNKSHGTYIGLSDKPNDMYGKVMAVPDEMIMQMFIDCTFVASKEIKEIEGKMKSGAENPREIKARLAREIVTIYYDAEAARNAEENFINTFKKGGIPEDAPEIGAKKGEPLTEALILSTLVSSKTEFRRLIKAGAITIVETGEKIEDEKAVIEHDLNLKIGKQRFLRIKIK